MSGETIEVFGTVFQLESNGVAVANGTLVPMTMAYDKVTNGNGGYPDGQFTLTCQFATAPLETTMIAVYARPMNVGGAGANTQVPETTRPTRLIGYFVVDNVTTAQTMEFMATDLPKNAQYYLYNVNTGQSIPAGWTAYVQPRTYKPAP